MNQKRTWHIDTRIPSTYRRLYHPYCTYFNPDAPYTIQNLWIVLQKISFMYLESYHHTLVHVKHNFLSDTFSSNIPPLCYRSRKSSRASFALFYKNSTSWIFSHGKLVGDYAPQALVGTSDARHLRFGSSLRLSQSLNTALIKWRCISSCILRLTWRGWQRYAECLIYISLPSHKLSNPELMNCVLKALEYIESVKSQVLNLV